MMFGLLFENTSMPVLEQVMAFTEERQHVLADNVANLDTPGYRATDLPVSEFTGALCEAIEQRDESTPRRFRMRSTQNINYERGMHASRVTVGGQMNFYDGGNRSVETLMNEMGKNALWHSAAVELFRQQGRLLETAIRERVS